MNKKEVVVEIDELLVAHDAYWHHCVEFQEGWTSFGEALKKRLEDKEE